MRRLLTGYAVTFNRRHRRYGRLFQNRYQSILCQENIYLLELVRYIHLNPIRAGIVKDLWENAKILGKIPIRCCNSLVKANLLGDSGSGPDGNGGWQVPRAEQIRCQSGGQ